MNNEEFEGSGFDIPTLEPGIYIYKIVTSTSGY